MDLNIYWIINVLFRRLHYYLRRYLNAVLQIHNFKQQYFLKPCLVSESDTNSRGAAQAIQAIKNQQQSQLFFISQVLTNDNKENISTANLDKMMNLRLISSQNNISLWNANSATTKFILKFFTTQFI